MHPRTAERLFFHKNEFTDSLLFVDFNLLEGAKEFDGKVAASRFNDYMLFNIDKFRSGEKQQVAQNFANFSEESYFPKLGYGTKESGSGRGTTAESFIMVLEQLEKKKMLTTLTHGNIYSTVFVKDYGPDKSSDTLITLITPELSDYTARVAKIYNIPTITKFVKCWNVDTHQWEKMPIILANTFGTSNLNDYLLICPEEILTNNLAYSMRDFIFGYWREIMNAKLEKDGQHKLTYNELKNFVKANYESNYAYMLMILNEIDSFQLQEYIDRSLYKSLVFKNKRMNDLNQE